MEIIGIVIFTALTFAVFFGPVLFAQDYIAKNKSEKPKAGHCW